MITFQLEGLGQIIRGLEQREQLVGASARRLIADYGAFFHDLTWQLSPYDVLELYDDYHMRENIRIETEEDGQAVVVGWYREDFEAEGFDLYPVYWEFGTVLHPAQPSLGPAFNALEPHLIGDAEEALLTALVEGRMYAGAPV